MKQTPELNQIQANMQPGALSAAGFLGNDKRNLVDILRTDEEDVARLGLTHQAIAQKMRDITNRAKKELGRPLLLAAGLEAVAVDYMGFIPCPFRDRRFFPKQLTTVTDQASGRSLCWSDLNIHMIAEHGFYEGRGSAFRVEPQDVADLLFRQQD